jgi:hypothetical protein
MTCGAQIHDDGFVYEAPESITQTGSYEWSTEWIVLANKNPRDTAAQFYPVYRFTKSATFMDLFDRVKAQRDELLAKLDELLAQLEEQTLVASVMRNVTQMNLEGAATDLRHAKSQRDDLLAAGKRLINAMNNPPIPNEKSWMMRQTDSYIKAVQALEAAIARTEERET